MAKKKKTDISLNLSLKDFYEQWEDSYIHGHEDKLIKLLIKHLKQDGIIDKSKY